MKKLILLIEDDEMIIDVYTTALEKIGHFKVEALKKGQDVLKWVQEAKQGKAKKPDLILLDLILPDMNGLDLLREMKKEKEIKDIPVFILTNYTSQELERISIDLKSEKYLTKAKFTVKELVEMVKERLAVRPCKK